MLGKAHLDESTYDKLRSDCLGWLRMHVAAGGVTVLLLFLGNRPAFGAQDIERCVHLFEFRCEFRIPAVSGHLDGFMASDGRQQRIAIHWVEPYMVREAPSFVRNCDFIFSPEAIRYWVAPGTQRGTILLASRNQSLLRARRDGTESIIPRTLAVIGRLAVQDMNGPASLEVAKFFANSRGLAEYAYESSPSGFDESESNPAESDARMLSMLPFARRYSKEKRSDGTLVWRAVRAMHEQSCPFGKPA